MQGFEVGDSRLSPVKTAVLRYYAMCGTLLDGELWECGVYRGGSARMIANAIVASAHTPTLRLFDTFDGMPEIGERDDGRVSKGTHADTSVEYVQRQLPEPFVVIHQGMIPATFRGLEDTKIAFAHIDVDIYQSTRDCMEFIFPRLVKNGIILVDDYMGHKGCREALEEFADSHPRCEAGLPNVPALVTRRTV